MLGLLEASKVLLKSCVVSLLQTFKNGYIFEVNTNHENVIYGIPDCASPPRPIYSQKGHNKRFLKTEKNRKKNCSEKSYTLPTEFLFGF